MPALALLNRISTSRRRSIPSAAAAIAFTVALLVAYGPLAYEFAVNTWRNKPHYQHFPFILLATAVLARQEINTPAKKPPPSKRFAPLLAMVAWCTLAVAYLIPSPLIAVASLWFSLAAAGCHFASRLGHPFPLAPWALLWLVLPPPAGLDNRIIQHLQHTSSWLASRTLDAIYINHLMEGNVLTLPRKALFVDEACSGIVSAVSIVTCAAIYSVLRRRSLARGLTLMTLAALWAILLNSTRIVSIAIAHTQLHLDWSDGIAHTCVGLATFSASLFTLIASDWLCEALLHNFESRSPSLSTPQDSADPARRNDGSTSRMLPIFSCALLLLGTTQTLSPPHLAATPTSIDQADVLVDKIEHSTLPAHMAGLTLTSTEHCKRDRSDPFGNHSVVFNYEADDGSTYLLSYDFPYVGGWHELSFCYTGIGWQLQDRSVTALRTNDDRRFDTAQLELLKPSGDHALVTFCANYLDGTPVPATDESIWGTVYSAFTRREVEQRGVSYQIQVVTSSASGLSEKHRQTSNALIKEAYTLLATATSRVAPRP